MGVPSFYRWLTYKFPDIVVNAKEEKGKCIDTSLPNPNGMEFDNLYLDMNGIIHPCFHPDDNFFPPRTFEEVFNNIFQYIDTLFNIVRPRNLLFLAIDGVAPRAKMNQQRARRFRTSKDNETVENEEERLRKQFQMEGRELLPKEDSEVYDSNIITPGTKFMYKLSEILQSYIRLRIKSDPGWKKMTVILSDANVPGEGEHKIMNFIRAQRSSPDYNPNTRHCLYGLDADLIMLALATHEVHFSILREDVLVQEQKPICESTLEFCLREAETCSAKSRGWLVQLSDCQKPSSKSTPEASHDATVSTSEIQPVKRFTPSMKKPYQFLHIWILREYLELDMVIINPPENFKAEFERTIDDFVFMCFFAGNDFLPHMPSLEIHEGVIDLLMHVYKKEFKNLGGYMVEMNRVHDKKGGYLKLKRVEKFILLVGSYEDKIFKKRADLREWKLRRILADCSDDQDDGEGLGTTGEMNRKKSFMDSETVANEDGTISSGIDQPTAYNYEKRLNNTKELKEKLKIFTRKISDVFKNGGLGIDKVKLGTEGYKKRYYMEKFSANSPEDIERTRKAVVEKYTEGLCWVLLYYYSGVPSWTWFYPFHYGPFASDLKGLAQVRVKFQKGLPFKPFDQLMGVLPPRSAHALPPAYGSLMINGDSDIIDFYPTDFEVDVDGKRFLWQGLCKLSFIEEERLLAATKKVEKDLKDYEAVRNMESVDKLFVGVSNESTSPIVSLLENQASQKQNEAIKIDTTLSGGIHGFIRLSNAVESDGSEDGFQEINVLCAFFEPPSFCQHIPSLLKGVILPEKTITEADIVETQLWHEYHGSKPPCNSKQTQRNYRKPSYNATSTSSGMIYKGSGSGWGAGRGKVLTSISHTYVHEEHHRRTFVNNDRVALPYSPSARGLSGNSGTYQGAYTYQKAYNCNVGFGRGERIGFEDLRISESNWGFNSNGRAQPVKNNVWQPRTISSSDNICDRRQGVQSNVEPSGRGWDRRETGSTETRSSVSQRNLASTANPSSWGRGRGQYVANSASQWNSRYSGTSEREERW